MAINSKSMDILFNSLNFYDNQYQNISQTCFDEFNKALNQIVEENFTGKAKVLPYGSYSLKTNYQLLEPMEFYVIITNCDKNYSQKKEAQEVQLAKQQKNRIASLKNIYNNILKSPNEDEYLSATETAKVICQKMKSYLSETDSVYCKNNMVFVKFKFDDENEIQVNITVAYDYQNNDILEFKKLGYKTTENCQLILDNMQQKNFETNGKYLVLCKLVKMLELELIINKLSNVFLSKKSLFIEHLLYNIPNNLLTDVDYSILFANATNYLKNCNISNIKLADNSTQMFKNQGYYAKQHFESIIKKILYLNKNTDVLLENVLKTAENENTHKINKISKK